MTTKGTPFPIVINVFEGLDVTAHDFREYARALQLPDPTIVRMPDELNDAATSVIQSGQISAWELYNQLRPDDYTFDDDGHEMLDFTDIKLKENVYENRNHSAH